METIILAVVVGTTVVAGVALLVARLMGRVRPRDGKVYHFRCPGCGRRLGFQSRQVGRKGKCSRCGKEFIFPHVAKSID